MNEEGDFFNTKEEMFENMFKGFFKNYDKKFKKRMIKRLDNMINQCVLFIGYLEGRGRIKDYELFIEGLEADIENLKKLMED